MDVAWRPLKTGFLEHLKQQRHHLDLSPGVISMSAGASDTAPIEWAGNLWPLASVPSRLPNSIQGAAASMVRVR